MCNVYEQAFRSEACTLQWAKQQGFWAIRAMGSKMFNEVVQELVIFGYGVVKVEKPLTYLSQEDNEVVTLIYS